MEVTFYTNDDAIWVEFDGDVYEREESHKDGVLLHYDKNDNLIRAIFVEISKGLNLKNVPPTERTKISQFMTKHNVPVMHR